MIKIQLLNTENKAPRFQTFMKAKGEMESCITESI